MAANSASNGSDTPFWPQWPPNHTSTTSTSTTHRHTQYTFRNLRLRPLCVCMFTLLFFTQGANLSRVYASSYLLTEMPRSAERMLTLRWCVLTMKPSENWRHRTGDTVWCLREPADLAKVMTSSARSHSGSSQTPVSSVPGDLTPSCALHG